MREEMAPLLHSGQFDAEPGPGEALLWRGEITPGVPSLILISGAGRLRAEETTGWLVRNHRPDILLSVGFGGGTRAALDTGTVVIATSVSMVDGTPLEWSAHGELASFASAPGYASRARMAVEVNGIDFAQGPVLTVPMVARSPGLKKWLGSRFGVYSLDLESYWVAQAAIAAEVPFLCVRAIVDSSDMILPGLVLEIPATPSGGRWSKAIRYALRDPRRVVEIARLDRASTRAGKQLAAFLTAFAEQIASPDGTGTGAEKSAA